MTRTKYPYLDSYNPPIPAVDVMLSNDEAGLRTGLMSALLDTGADGSLVPIRLLREVMAYPIAEAFLRSHWGEQRRVHLFRVDLQINDIILPGVTVVGDDIGQEIVLGRDVLNRLKIFLNGPEGLSEVWE